MKMVISEQALNDIENIWLFTAENWSTEQADRYYNLIFEEIEFICKHFNAGKSIESIRKGYRYTKVKSHLIFYRRSVTEEIEIIRILHEHMDIESRLNDK